MYLIYLFLNIYNNNKKTRQWKKFEVNRLIEACTNNKEVSYILKISISFETGSHTNRIFKRYKGPIIKNNKGKVKRTFFPALWNLIQPSNSKASWNLIETRYNLTSGKLKMYNIE